MVEFGYDEAKRQIKGRKRLGIDKRRRENDEDKTSG